MASYGRKHHRVAEREVEALKEEPTIYDKITKKLDIIRFATNCFLLGLIVADLIVKLAVKREKKDEE